MDQGPRLGRLIVASMAFFALAGSAWYIAQLQAENARLQKHSGTGGVPAVVPVAPTPRPVGPGARTLSDSQREAILNKLRGDLGEDHQVWLATVGGNDEAAAFRMTLQTLIEEAGWQVRSNQTVPFPIKPGLYFFAADEEPPGYAVTLLDALKEAGLEVNSGVGYRDFYQEKKRANPNWNGFDMAPDQAFVLVVGPKPAS